jgi:hypothetical protein
METQATDLRREKDSLVWLLLPAKFLWLPFQAEIFQTQMKGLILSMGDSIFQALEALQYLLLTGVPAHARNITPDLKGYL